MILKQFILGALENNNYLLIDDVTKEAVLIDCSEDREDIHDTIKEYGAKLKYILLTHGHFDHVLGVNAFKARYPDCKVLLHEADKKLLQDIKKFVNTFALDIIGSRKVEATSIDELIKEGDIITFGYNEIKVIHTPGHSKGGVCFLIDDMLFTGDTLFYETIGRTDLTGGSFDEIKSSIEDKLFMLNDNIKVYPGHGWESTIGHEKVNNNFE